MITVRQRVLDFLDKVKPLRYCDDCIAARLGIAHRQQVRKACMELADDHEIDRQEAYCADCHGMKLTSRFLVAPVPSTGPEGEVSELKSHGPKPSLEAGRDKHHQVTLNERNAIEKVSKRVHA